MTLNAGELFLFERLPDALLLEKSMKAIRQKYDDLWASVCKWAHPELKRQRIRATDAKSGVVFGRASWDTPWPAWPSGFYVWGVSFENLCNDGEDRPELGVWLRPPTNRHIDLNSARKRLHQQIVRLLGDADDESGQRDISLGWKLPESRQQLLCALNQNGGREFIKIMFSHLRSLAPLIPEIDRVFDKGARRGK